MYTVGIGAAMNLFIQNTMVPAAVPISQAYGLDTTTMVNMCVFLYFVFALPATAVNMYLFQNFRTGLILRIAISIQFFGSLFRMYTFVNGEFWPVFMGHFI